MRAAADFVPLLAVWATAPAGTNAGPVHIVLAMLGPLARLRLRAACLLCGASVSAREALEILHTASLPTCKTPSWAGLEGSVVSVRCPAVFLECLLGSDGSCRASNLPRLLGLPRLRCGDRDEYEVAASLEMLAVVIAKGASAATTDKANCKANAVESNAGRSGLHLAAASGKGLVAEVLLEASADPNASDVLGYTPVDLALCRQQLAALPVLARAGGLGSSERRDMNRLDIVSMLSRQQEAASPQRRELWQVLQKHRQLRHSLGLADLKPLFLPLRQQSTEGSCLSLGPPHVDPKCWLRLHVLDLQDLNLRLDRISNCLLRSSASEASACPSDGLSAIGLDIRSLDSLEKTLYIAERRLRILEQQLSRRRARKRTMHRHSSRLLLAWVQSICGCRTL
eukprot:TRINITY_DN93476_c0_g1_i1.p1 TRINITY_DN93476_c0_g1~~TRINITY_DN93476_c0_g1_i1.p1  ORF type:complete len:398 (-),score=46.90 TRINITY_DN93476_c0_g1_i1:97-1290(-)